MSLQLRKRIRDADWVRQSFLVGDFNVRGEKVNNLDDVDVRNRDFTTARFKFVDTTPGGNLAINAPAQFTRNADIKARGLLAGVNALGRYYSEAIDDNNRLVSMRFGVPDFNALTTFWTGFYNADEGTLARTGRPRGFLFKVGYVIGFVIPLLSLPLFIANLSGNAYRYLTLSPSSRYYYLRPTMHNYWSAVNTVFNRIAINKGVVPRVFSDETKKKLDNTYLFSKSDFDILKERLPDIVMDDYGISAFAIATKAQRNARRVTKAIESVMKRNGDRVDVVAEMTKIYSAGLPVEPDKNKTFLGYIQKWLKSESNVMSDATHDQKSKDQSKLFNITESESDSFWDYVKAELDDGAAFATFRVDAEGGISESFSNQTGQPEIASKFNNISAAARSNIFNVGSGNIGDGIGSNMLEFLVGGVKDVMAGVAAGIGASGLAALGGGAFVDIPNVWTGSTAQLPRMNYTLTLTSPYGNKISQLFNIYLPLSMLLAGALPLSTGRSSYTSPFILELYDRGRAQTRLGIIDSLSITRGVSNLAFDNNGNAMAIDVAFSVVDLSSVLHMPVAQGFGLTNLTASAFGDDNSFDDYMATISGLSLHEQIYTGERVKLALTRQMVGMRQWASPGNIASFLTDNAVGRFLGIFYEGNINR